MAFLTKMLVGSSISHSAESLKADAGKDIFVSPSLKARIMACAFPNGAFEDLPAQATTFFRAASIAFRDKEILPFLEVAGTQIRSE